MSQAVVRFRPPPENADLGTFLTPERARGILPSPPKLFRAGGGLGKPPAFPYAYTSARAAARPHTCSGAGVASRQNQRRFFARFCHNSVAVLRLWQEWHRLSRLPGSVNLAQSPLWSTMWSTSVARVRMPRFAHSLHQGSFSSCSGRSCSSQTFVRYIQRQLCASSLRSLTRRGRWASQYPSVTRAPHPGCRQGLFGFMAMGYHLQAQNAKKTRTDDPTHQVVHQLWSSRHWPSAIFAI